METHAALLVERVLPRLVPPAIMTGLFASASWVDIWTHIPHQARPYVLASYALLTLASPLLTRGKSVIVRKKDALRHLDREAGAENAFPATALRAHAPAGVPPDSLQAWNHQQDKLLQKWVPQLRAHKPAPDIARQWVYALAASTLAVLGTGLAAGDQRIPRLMEALNSTAPPVVLPPPDVKAWVAPPKGFKGLAAQYLEEGKALEPAHKKSILYVTVLGSQPNVTLNGRVIEPLRTSAADKGGQATTQYAPTELGEGVNEVSVAGGPVWKIDVSPDNAPVASIDAAGIAAGEDGTLALKCTKADDFGVTGGKVVLSLPGGAADQTGVLPAARLPGLTLPGQGFCDTPPAPAR
jgi:hypothetical protein